MTIIVGCAPKVNKSFVLDVPITYEEERTVADKYPVEPVEIKELYEIMTNIDIFDCKVIPVEILIKVQDNRVTGEILNKFEDYYKKIDSKNCSTIHSGKFEGKVDEQGRFKKVFVKHPTSSFNLNGLHRIDGTIDQPKLRFKQPFYKQIIVRSDFLKLVQKLARTLKNIQNVQHV